MNENTPEHYRTHGMECIKEMMLVFGKEATLNFCKLNVWKYRYRAGAILYMINRNHPRDVLIKTRPRWCPLKGMRNEERRG